MTHEEFTREEVVLIKSREKGNVARWHRRAELSLDVRLNVIEVRPYGRCPSDLEERVEPIANERIMKRSIVVARDEGASECRVREGDQVLDNSGTVRSCGCRILVR